MNSIDKKSIQKNNNKLNIINWNENFKKDKSNKIKYDLWESNKNDKTVGGINNLVTRIITRRFLFKLVPIHTENKSKKTVITKKVKKTKKNEKNKKNEKTKKLKKSKKSKK
tara:strand:+ start:6713 stop:7045 length:333 start_codon:yes stop_codon:yes gene_type:complete